MRVCYRRKVIATVRRLESACREFVDSAEYYRGYGSYVFTGMAKSWTNYRTRLETAYRYLERRDSFKGWPQLDLTRLQGIVDHYLKTEITVSRQALVKN